MTMTDKGACAGHDAPSLERVRFFARQLVTPGDLTQDQDYFRAKARRHNRLLHGWGVVCGANVRGSPTRPSEVVIEPGYVLGPFGDEIVIDAEVTVDVCQETLDGEAVSCAGAVDPWCSDVRVDRPAGVTLYVAVRYAECESRPVRSYPAGCGCGEGDCEYSRIRDGFAIKILSRLPSTYDPMPTPDFGAVIECVGGNRPCPPCPSEPWVILADVTMKANCEVATVAPLTHRRFVASFADFYFVCPDGDVADSRDPSA